MKLLFPNKKVKFNYFILDTYECGIELKGTEVKSIMKANANIDEAFAIIRHNEAFVINMLLLLKKSTLIMLIQAVTVSYCFIKMKSSRLITNLKKIVLH